jgi:hypothetical protein
LGRHAGTIIGVFAVDRGYPNVSPLTEKSRKRINLGQWPSRATDRKVLGATPA